MKKKIVRFENNGKIRFGELRDSEILFDDNVLNKDQVNILPPINPNKIICVGLNYKDHIKEMDRSLPNSPVFFYKPPSSVIGHKDIIKIPNMANQVDFEAEIAVIIDKECKNVSENKVNDYIKGYTCLNDVTARDIQEKEKQWVISKGFDTFCPIGPCVSTEIPDNAKIVSFKNENKKQSSNIGELIFSVEELISRLSKAITLKEGDVVSTGTPSGVGEINKGDEVKIKVEGIGELKNKVD